MPDAPLTVFVVDDDASIRDSLALMLGLYIPPYLEGWYRAAARMIGG